MVDSAVPLAVVDWELEDELVADCVRDGGGLPVELVLAVADDEALLDDDRVCAADAVIEAVLEPVEVADAVSAALALAEPD